MVTVFDILKQRGQTFNPSNDKFFGQDVSRAKPTGNIFDAIKKQNTALGVTKKPKELGIKLPFVSGFAKGETPQVATSKTIAGRSASGIQDVRPDANFTIQKSATRPFTSQADLNKPDIFSTPTGRITTIAQGKKRTGSVGLAKRLSDNFFGSTAKTGRGIPFIQFQESRKSSGFEIFSNIVGRLFGT